MFQFKWFTMGFRLYSKLVRSFVILVAPKGAVFLYFIEQIQTLEPQADHPMCLW